MMETDMPVCVLTCFGVYGGLQGQKLVKNKPKIADLAHQIPTIQSGASLLCWDIPNDYLWSYMMETDMPVCVLNCFRVYDDVQG